MIAVAKGFQTSVNIAFDLYNDEKVKSFIPTVSSLDIFEDIMLSVASKTSQRARIFIGAYGRGKSHIILVLLSILFKKDRDIFINLLAKMQEANPKLSTLVNEYIESDKRLLPIVVSGSSSSLTQSFLSALQLSLSYAGLDDLMPETHFRASLSAIENWREHYPDTYRKFISLINEPVDDFLVRLGEYEVPAYERFTELYPMLTSGSSFNPFLGFDVVELYEKVTEKLCENGYNGIFIIYDEFSKYLESSIAATSISDIKLLQDFAEKCDRSGTKQMHLMLISHKDIANYIDGNLPKEKVDGWRGVSGRFKHITLHNNFSQMYEIISAVIKKTPNDWATFCNSNSEKFDDLHKRFVVKGFLNSTNRDLKNTTVKDCYPLHPISTFILPRISEKIAQNERTLFTFLSTTEKYTLASFWNTTEDDFPLLTPDLLYDYFEPLLRKEPYTSETHRMYKLTASILRKLSPNSLGSKIVKTLSLIYIIEQFEILPPTYDTIVEVFHDIIPSTKLISDAMNELIEKECIVYLKRSNNYLKLKENSGIDITSEIDKVIERITVVVSVEEILNSSSYDSFLYPTRYNDEYEITRYFDFSFINSSDFFRTNDWEDNLQKSNADGIVYAIIPRNSEEIAQIRDVISSGHHDNNRIMFVIPRKYQSIKKIAYEYRAVIQLKSLISDDELLRDEYDIYIEDLEEVISNFIFSYVRPENNGADYYYLGECHRLHRKAQFSALLSRICEGIYPLTPIINNESINKNDLPTVAVNSRTKILAGLLANRLEPFLGLTGTGQEVSIMRSTLIKTGILENIDSSPVIQLYTTDEKMTHVLDVIKRFFSGASAKNGQQFSLLYRQLASPTYGIGLKRGVIPLYIATVLHLCKQTLVIKYGTAEARITPDLLNSINVEPEKYSVIMEDWNEDKARYMAVLEEQFSDFIVDSEKVFNAFSYLVTAMSRWYMSLPKYVKDTNVTYLGNKKFDPIPMEQKKFINAIRQFDGNPRDFLFEKIFTIFGYNRFDVNVTNDIIEVKDRLNITLQNLISKLSSDVKEMFGGIRKRPTLSSVMRDWYETLSTKTLQFLFPNKENKVLELIKSVTSDESTFIYRLGKSFTGLRIDDWDTNTIKAFLTDLLAFKTIVEDYNRDRKTIENAFSGSYRFVFSDANGNETVRAFVKSDYSKKAKLLRNEISTALDEMGQAITEQEKRQVLIDILEELC